MSHLDIKKALSHYGLSEQEIKVYLAVLRLGTATIREIAIDTKIKRTTIYLIADKLVARGIMGKYHAKYGAHYTVSTPKNLLTKLDDIKKEIATVIPQLEVIEKRDLHEPNIKLYRGQEGYLTVLNDSLQGYSHEVLYLASAKDLNKIVSEKYITDRYIQTRLKRNIKFRELVFPDKFSKMLRERDAKELRQTKFLSEEHYFTTSLFIYRNKIAYFTSERELICVLIESQEIAETERKKFELLWGNCSY